MMKVVAPLRKHFERGLNDGLGLRIDGGRRLIEDQDRRVERQRPGERNQLPLPGRQRPALLDHGLVDAVRQALRRFLCADLAQGQPPPVPG